MAKKRRSYSPRRFFRRRGRGKRKISIAIAAGLAGTVLGGKGETTLSLIQGGNMLGALYRTCINFTGYDPATGSWRWESMNLEPLIAGTVVHLTLGRFVNKYLSKVPYVNL